MHNAQSFALEAAKEITIAALQGCKNQVNLDLGGLAADYSEAVYNKVFKLARDDDSKSYNSL